MKIHATSYFKNAEQDILWFENWVTQLESNNRRAYDHYIVNTSLGKTIVYGINTQKTYSATLVIFPGARTTSLIWDFDKALDLLGKNTRIFLVETNGLPNLSDGKSPDIKSLDYGYWAAEVMQQLGIEKAFVAGASFGGVICMKLGIVKPTMIQAAFLLNPGCLQPFSLSFSNLYYNLLPIFSPTPANVTKFLNKAIFAKPTHSLSPMAEKMLVDYEVFALKQYKDLTQKPYYMKEQLAKVTVETYLLVGDRDLLFPFQKSIVNAKKHLPNLKEFKVFESVGHGIETYPKAIEYLREKIDKYCSIIQ